MSAERLLALAVAVSVVHYADNYFNYADYPAGGPLPDPSRALIGVAWFVFVAFAVAAFRFLRAAEVRLAAVCLAVFAGSGLVGVGHYTVPGAFDMPWWRHAHVVADIACGIALLVAAVRLLRRQSQRRTLAL
jgi:hypothetical protein